MKEPQKIKLTDSPESKRVKLTPLPSLEDKYPETMKDDIYIKPKDNEIELMLSRLFSPPPEEAARAGPKLDPSAYQSPR